MADSLLADRDFWLNASERAGLTLIQTITAEIVTVPVASTAYDQNDGTPWYPMICIAVLAAVISFLTSIGKGSVGVAGSGVELRGTEGETPDPGSETPPACDEADDSAPADSFGEVTDDDFEARDVEIVVTDPDPEVVVTEPTESPETPDFSDPSEQSDHSTEKKARGKKKGRNKKRPVQKEDEKTGNPSTEPFGRSETYPQTEK